ncbi:MAG: hypothetical protein JZD41_09595, partial [Thermoproteus sp.]|nr:hypothetical protein [Thermoproteus sp.]
IHSVDGGARIVAEHLPQYGEYIERLGKIADLLKAAARELVEEAEREGKGGIVKINGRPYIAYEGPVELSVRVEHVTRGEKTYAVIEAKYGERTARVELDIKKYWRSGLLHNLAAIMTDDARDFYTGRVLHGTTGFVQASERLLMWDLFMSGEYKITVRYVKETEDGLSPYIEISSRFGQGGLAKIERESPIHRLVLKLARELAGGEKLNVDKVLAASWLLASAILNTPDGGRPSEGLAVLAERMAEATARRIAWEMAAREGKRKADDEVMERARRIVREQGLEGKYRKALERLRPLLEELDKDEKDGGLGTVSREDKAYLVGKIVDYDGNVRDGLLLVKADTIKRIMIELVGVEINMADVAEAAAKAFSENGGWSGDNLYFGPAREALELKVDEEAPLKAPAFKAMAALIAQKADELRRKELVEHVELRRYEIDGGELKIMAAKAKEELTPITRENREEIWKGFEDRRYTHSRLVVGDKEYELLSLVEDRSAGRVNVKFRIKGKEVRELEEALRGLGSDVKRTPSGYLFLSREDLEALLDKGVKAYAVRRAKKGEAMWRLEITYRGVTVELEMYYHERENRLEKHSKTRKIEAIVREEGASEGKSVELDLGLLAAIREGSADCGRCLEKWLAEALSATASEKGFSWSVRSDRKYLIVYLPSDFRDAVRRFYSK